MNLSPCLNFGTQAWAVAAPALPIPEARLVAWYLSDYVIKKSPESTDRHLQGSFPKLKWVTDAVGQAH